MTETPPTPPAPQFRLIRAGLPDLMGTLLTYAAPATQHLDEAIRRRVEATQTAPNDAVRDTPHFDMIEEWCKQHPADAARVVLCAVYLASGRFAVQDMLAPEPEPTPNPTLDAAAAVAAQASVAEPAAAPEAKPD
jgi:hypothetical protein